jgi:hypothetical protein
MTDRPHCLAQDACASRGPRHCRRCANVVAATDPVRESKRLSALRVVMQTPEYRSAMSEVTTRRKAELMADPVFAEKLRQHGRATIGALRGHKGMTPEVRARVGQALSEQRLGWCPRAYRTAYQRYRVQHGAKLAREMIEADIRDEGRRIVAANQAAMLIKHLRDKAQAY